MVGSDEYAFTVHERLLCDHANFFKAACSAEWKEGQTRTVRLPPATPAHFEIYLDCLYSQQKVDVTQKLTALLAEEGVSYSYQDDIQPLQIIDNLCDLWRLADYILDIDFQNTVLKNLLMHDLPQRRLILPATIRNVITNSPKESGLQRWMMDHLAQFVAVADLDKMHEWLPADVIFELLKKVVPCRHVNKSLVPTLQNAFRYSSRILRVSDPGEASPNSASSIESLFG